MADLKKALERTRAGYDEEKRWHRFLLDSYTGGGGYKGRIGCTDAELGSAACIYGEKIETYLDRHPREDTDKFKRRVRISHYTNYIEAITDLKVGFALNKPPKVEDLPEAIAEWKRNADGEGESFESLRARVALRAATFGWAPCLVDLDGDAEELTLAQAQQSGRAPRLVLLYPANLTEWDVRGDEVRWVKVRTDFTERESFDVDERSYARFDVWTGMDVRTWELDKSTGAQPLGPVEAPNPWGRVPLAVCRHKPAEDSPIVGLPMHGGASLENRRIFNLVSALDENLDAQGFAVLVLAEKAQSDTDGPEGEDDRVIGPANALTIDPDSKRDHYYLAPPASVAEAFEKRIENSIRELYRMARVEFVRPSSQAGESGIARKHAFQQTSNAIASFSAQIAEWELEVYKLVGQAMGVPEAELDKIRVTAPSDFSVEDIDDEIKHAITAVTAKLGSTASAEIRKRLARVVLRGLDESKIAEIDDEIDQAATEDASVSGFTRGVTDGAGGNRGGGTPPGAGPAGGSGPGAGAGDRGGMGPDPRPAP